MTVSRQMLKNALARVRPDIVAELGDITINGQLQGCSGFLVDPTTGHCVYVSTDANHGRGPQALYRTAKHRRDFVGGADHFCPLDADELVSRALALL